MFLFVERMFKGGKENENAAGKFFKQQDKDQDGSIDRVSLLTPKKKHLIVLEECS